MPGLYPQEERDLRERMKDSPSDFTPYEFALIESLDECRQQLQNTQNELAETQKQCNGWHRSYEEAEEENNKLREVIRHHCGLPPLAENERHPDCKTPPPNADWYRKQLEKVRFPK